jgi:hypothetical protein
VLNGNCTCVGELSTGIDPSVLANVDFAIYPNPASTGPWTVVIGDLGQVVGTVTFEVVNVLGEQVLSRTLNMDGRSAKTLIDLGTSLATGTYVAKLHAGDHTYTQRVIVR